MEFPAFNTWLEQRHRDRPDAIHVHAADRLMELIRTARPPGISRRRLGHVIDQEPRLLNQFLDALVSLGQISVTTLGHCGDYYQSGSPGMVVGVSEAVRRKVT